MATAAKIVRSLLTHRSSPSSSSSMTKSAFPPAFSRHSSVSNVLLLNRSRSAYSPLNSSNSMPPVCPRRDVSSNHLRFYSGRSAIQRNRFPKHHKGRIDGIADGGGEICFGKYGLQALEPARITSRQIEAGRRALQLKARLGGRGGKVWVRTFPYRSVTAKPSETRMGRGKGAISHWVAAVKPGQILYEMGGIRESLARKAIQIAGSKMPIRTKSVIRDEKIKEIGIR